MYFDGRRRVYRVGSVRVGSVFMWVGIFKRGSEGIIGGVRDVGNIVSV